MFTEEDSQIIRSTTLFFGKVGLAVGPVVGAYFYQYPFLIKEGGGSECLSLLVDMSLASTLLGLSAGSAGFFLGCSIMVIDKVVKHCEEQLHHVVACACP